MKRKRSIRNESDDDPRIHSSTLLTTEENSTLVSTQEVLKALFSETAEPRDNIPMEINAGNTDNPHVTTDIDQEMAYDRVHPLYLRQTMLAFGFPPSLVHSLESLFFGNAVRININGYFTNRIDQRRGLRQGNPLSPLLFNIALESFLQHILQDSFFQGFQFQVVSNSAITTSNTMPSPLKVLAYADDVCVLLHFTDDYYRLRHHLDRYESVSNAKVNIHKTEAFSLDGRSYPE
ncbi:hypothetical protein G6F37_000053 [Rhizopus arrhizus]|nr:hypothetical protein G6F38_000041 [Rhizopus arrhizus]KAG1164712.1 hypothetical protein G6F37_000053 [Rhizopus arrhizus]